MLKELSKSGSGSLIRTMHSEIQIPKSYSEDIFLLRTDVAGTTHTAGIEELAPFLAPGERLELVRVPGNPSDPNAIKIFIRDGVKLGYVPRRDNPILARLMDAGKLLNDHLYEGRYSPTNAQGKREVHTVYAKTKEECETLLEQMIAEVKAKIAAEKELLKAEQNPPEA